jgi:HAMP domain-containing protein
MTSLGPIPAPWVLVDDDTLDQAAALLERLTDWLTAETRSTSRCAQALSLGETDDPITIANWADALAARLRRRAKESQIQTTEPNRPNR